MVMTDTEKNKH